MSGLWTRRRVLASLRSMGIPETGEVDELVAAVGAHLGREIAVFADPLVRLTSQARAEEQPDASILLRVCGDRAREAMVCRTLATVLFPEDSTSAEHAWGMFRQHLAESRKLQRRRAENPMMARLEESLRADSQPVLLQRAWAWQRTRTAA